MLFTGVLLSRFRCFWTSSFCFDPASSLKAPQETENIRPHRQRTAVRALFFRQPSPTILDNRQKHSTPKWGNPPRHPMVNGQDCKTHRRARARIEWGRTNGSELVRSYPAHPHTTELDPPFPSVGRFSSSPSLAPLSLSLSLKHTHTHTQYPQRSIKRLTFLHS